MDLRLDEPHGGSPRDIPQPPAGPARAAARRFEAAQKPARLEVARHRGRDQMAFGARALAEAE
ncbi:MAG: hypothetical protein Fur0037_03690 [Planctomycetota bacterium]